MQKKSIVNAILVFHKDEDKILMCLRKKDPYKGKYNMVGGKVEAGEDGIEAAYRELEEESGITKEEIVLTHLMDFQYYHSNLELQIYVGKCNKEVELVEEVNPLCWMSVEENFFDTQKFAGEGNIGHMLKQVYGYPREFSWK